MSLSQTLSTVSTDSFSDDQGPWRQFILDHLDYISKKSQNYVISDEVLNLYRYDLKRYLRQELSRQYDLAWIVQLLNDLPNDFSFDFDEKNTYVIPSDDLIQTLYTSYVTIISNAF